MNSLKFEDIIFKKRKDGICYIILNRPERRNALSQQTFLEIEQALIKLNRDDEVKVLILTGCKEANAFSSGGYLDLKFSIPNTRAPQQSVKKVPFWEFKKPVIAAINGLAVGAGITMPLLCADLLYMSDQAWIQFNFVHRGIMTQSAMSYILPLTMGFQKAKEILYYGNKIDAHLAETLGLVNKVVAHNKLLSYAEANARKLIKANKGLYSLNSIKSIIQQNFRTPILTTHELEKSYNRQLFRTHDFREGIRALKKKRTTHFKGK